MFRKIALRNDKTISIDWPLEEVSLSSKDNAAFFLKRQSTLVKTTYA